MQFLQYYILIYLEKKKNNNTRISYITHTLFNMNVCSHIRT